MGRDQPEGERKTHGTTRISYRRKLPTDRFICRVRRRRKETSHSSLFLIQGESSLEQMNTQHLLCTAMTNTFTLSVCVRDSKGKWWVVTETRWQFVKMVCALAAWNCPTFGPDWGTLTAVIQVNPADDQSTSRFCAWTGRRPCVCQRSGGESEHCWLNINSFSLSSPWFPIPHLLLLPDNHLYISIYLMCCDSSSSFSTDTFYHQMPSLSFYLDLLYPSSFSLFFLSAIWAGGFLRQSLVYTGFFTFE